MSDSRHAKTAAGFLVKSAEEGRRRAVQNRRYYEFIRQQYPNADAITLALLMSYRNSQAGRRAAAKARAKQKAFKARAFASSSARKSIANLQRSIAAASKRGRIKLQASVEASNAAAQIRAATAISQADIRASSSLNEFELSKTRILELLTRQSEKRKGELQAAFATANIDSNASVTQVSGNRLKQDNLRGVQLSNRRLGILDSARSVIQANLTNIEAVRIGGVERLKGLKAFSGAPHLIAPSFGIGSTAASRRRTSISNSNKLKVRSARQARILAQTSANAKRAAAGVRLAGTLSSTDISLGTSLVGLEAEKLQAEAVQRQVRDLSIGKVKAGFGAARIESLAAQEDARRESDLKANIAASEFRSRREQTLGKARSAIASALAGYDATVTSANIIESGAVKASKILGLAK